MCGIAGIVNLDGRLSGERLGQLCRAMCDTMVHRGPNDHGVWVDPKGRCALGHRRLSIIDTSAAGRQPMASAAGGVLSFNGEIYNFGDLREAMLRDGHAFTSHSDTEVLLAGLDRDGADFLDHIDGMYAFAHFDGVSGRLLLARDRFGEKPLYLYRSGGLLAFASELSAFAVLPDFDDRVEADTIARYLTFQYVPAPASIYRAASKLPPGDCVEVRGDGSLTTLKRWRFRTSGILQSGRRIDDLADELEDILLRSLRTRLIADVPLGAFLSGGVDSSTVVALIRKRLNRSIQTFSIGFSGSDDSEHEAARAMAAHIGTEHIDKIVEPRELGEMVRFIGGLLDEPNGDSSCMPTWQLSELARGFVTVALSGDGGDEMFGGYGRYFSTLTDRERHAQGDPRYAAWTPGAAYYSTRLLLFTERDLTTLFGSVPPAVAAELAELRGKLNDDPRPLLNRLREADAGHYLPGAVLPKVDRMSMQHSLEVRSPLLSNEVADFAMRLAETDCWTGSGGKEVLKVVARRYLPAEWIDRRKMGFGLPMRSWAEGTAMTAAAEILKPGHNRLSEWIGQDGLDRFLAAQQSAPMLYQLWAVLILESWLRTHPARPA